MRGSFDFETAFLSRVSNCSSSRALPPGYDSLYLHSGGEAEEGGGVVGMAGAELARGGFHLHEQAGHHAAQSSAAPARGGSGAGHRSAHCRSKPGGALVGWASPTRPNCCKPTASAVGVLAAKKT
jgi:hypothetical protein